MPPVIRLYQEHPVFDAFSKFDLSTGQLTAITEQEFIQLEAATVKEATCGTDGDVRRFDGEKATVFKGPVNRLRTRFPRRIYFQITRNCNLECPYCFLKSSPGQPHVPTEALLKMAEYLGLNGLMEVRLTGGEPTTHPEFFRIVDAFGENGVYVSVATNGMLSRKTMDGLADRDGLWLICSLDGPRDIHNSYRPGSYDRVLQNLTYLKKRKPELRLRLTTVLTQRNKNSIRSLAKLTKALDAESITIIPLRPQVRTPGVIKEMISAAEFKDVIDEIDRITREMDVKITTTLATDRENKIHKDAIVRKRGACAAGREATNLDYDARHDSFMVYGCSYSPASDLQATTAIRAPFVAGIFPALEPEHFSKIWQDDSAWSIYRDDGFKSRECQDCHFFNNNKCIGSCPIQNIDYGSIDIGQSILQQLRDQLSGTAEWYCYKNLV